MKTNTRLTFLILTFLLLTIQTGYCGDGSKASPYRIFWIGNSNTYMWGWYPSSNPDMAADPALPKYVKAMAAKAPRPVYMNYSFKMSGGKNLEWHWLNGAQDSIKKGNYDFVVLNDHSTATFAYPDKFQKYSKLFDSLCKVHGAKPIFFMGWPDDDEWTLRRDVIINSYDKLAEDLNSELAPLGRAWELVEQRKSSLNLFQDDKHHPNELGVYMNTCVFYSIITNTPPVNIKYNQIMNWAKPTDDDYSIIENAAWDACRERLDVENEIKLSSKIVEPNDIALTWTKPVGSAPAMYAVYYNATNVFYTKDTSYIYKNANSTFAHTFAVLGLKSDTLPLYNSNGIVTSIEDVYPPSVPTNISITSQGSNFVFLKWDVSTDFGTFKEYIIYLDGTEYKKTSKNNLMLSNLIPGTTYTVEIAASDIIPNVSAKSSPFTFTFETITSTQALENNIKIYPNPTINKAKVIASPGAFIQLFDVNGTLKQQEIVKDEFIELDLTNKNAGIYFVKITMNGRCVVRKILKE